MKLKTRFVIKEHLDATVTSNTTESKLTGVCRKQADGCGRPSRKRRRDEEVQTSSYKVSHHEVATAEGVRSITAR